MVWVLQGKRVHAWVMIAPGKRDMAVSRSTCSPLIRLYASSKGLP
jgi:hypothetical protein